MPKTLPIMTLPYLDSRFDVDGGDLLDGLGGGVQVDHTLVDSAKIHLLI